MVPAESEEHGQRTRDEKDTEEHLVRPEIGPQTAADPRDHLVGHIAVEFALGPVPFFRGSRSGIFRLPALAFNLFRPAQDPDDPLDGGAGHHAVASAFLQKELGHPFLDAFENLAAAFAALVEALQFIKVAGCELEGVALQREGKSAQTDLFYLFHACLSVAMVSTSSRQAVSISESCSRPLSVIT